MATNGSRRLCVASPDATAPRLRRGSERMNCHTSPTSPGVNVCPHGGIAADFPIAGPPSRMTESAVSWFSAANTAESPNAVGVTPKAALTL